MSLNIGVTALTSYKTALQVVGHNIANANTQGYSRQTVSLHQIQGQNFGAGYIGKGVELVAVERAFDRFLTREANLATASAEAADLRYRRLQTLEQLFPMGEAGMGTQLNGFLNAWTDAVSSPTNQTARGVVLTRAEELAKRFTQTGEQLEELRITSKVQLDALIAQANRLTVQIANLNQRVVEGYAAGHPPNDVMDQRDQLIADLNKIVQVSTVESDDHSMTVFVGGSVPVVLGNQSTDLVGSETVSTQGRYTVGFGKATALISETLLSGGQLNGALRFYNDDVADVRNQLGRMVLATVEHTNRQHRQGIDLNGEAGVNFFNAISLDNTISKLDPASPAELALSVSPGANAPSEFQASDYAVRYLGTDQVQIQRVSDQAYFDPATGKFSSSTAVAATFAAPDNAIDFDGLRLTQTTSGNVGDQLVLKPMKSIAEQVTVALTAPAQLAIASPVLVNAGGNNSQSLLVEALYRPANATNTPPAGWSSSTIEFVAGGYTIDGGAVQTFVSGQAIDVHGYSLTLRGKPTVGDTFEVRLPAAGETMRQNAGNGHAMLALRDIDALDGYSLSDGYISVFAAVASQLQISKSDHEFATRVAQQAESVRANQAGVNLDEEAARLMQFQQSYQASAKYMQTMQTVLDALFSAFR